MALETGSVVVPLKSETMARSWPVMALIRDDFPAFRQPNRPMWIRSLEGVALREAGMESSSFGKQKINTEQSAECIWKLFQFIIQ